MRSECFNAGISSLRISDLRISQFKDSHVALLHSHSPFGLKFLHKCSNTGFFCEIKSIIHFWKRESGKLRKADTVCTVGTLICRLSIYGFEYLECFRI